MKKVILAALSALFLCVSCSDDDSMPDWYIDKPLTEQDISGHSFKCYKTVLSFNKGYQTVTVYKTNQSWAINYSYSLDGDTLRFIHHATGTKLNYWAHLIRYGEDKPLSLVLRNDNDNEEYWGGLCTGVFDQRY